MKWQNRLRWVLLSGARYDDPPSETVYRMRRMANTFAADAPELSRTVLEATNACLYPPHGRALTHADLERECRGAIAALTLLLEEEPK